jgi:hypothetical protein
MLGKAWFVVFGGLSFSPELAFADDASAGRCVAVSAARDAVAAHNGTWIELTTDEWQFLRGIYAMKSGAPAGLPVGGKAALARVSGFDDGMVFFIDGDQACNPMRAPPELLLLMHEVSGGSIIQLYRGR